MGRRHKTSKKPVKGAKPVRKSPPHPPSKPISSRKSTPKKQSVSTKKKPIAKKSVPKPRKDSSKPSRRSGSRESKGAKLTQVPKSPKGKPKNLKGVRKFSTHSRLSGQVTLRAMNVRDGQRILLAYQGSMFGWQASRPYRIKKKGEAARNVQGYSPLRKPNENSKRAIEAALRDTRISAFRNVEPEVRYEKDGSPTLVPRYVNARTTQAFDLIIYMNKKNRKQVLNLERFFKLK